MKVLSSKLNYGTIKMKPLTFKEVAIFDQYTDATCLEAYQKVLVDNRTAKNFAVLSMFTTVLLVVSIILFCMFGFHIFHELSKKHNYFG